MKYTLCEKNREKSYKIINCDLDCGPSCDTDLGMDFEFGGRADTSSCKNEVSYTIVLLCLSALLLLLPLILPSLPPPPPIFMLIPTFIMGMLFLLMASVPPAAELVVGTPL
ncbi:hypothetical protein SUGI_0569420 [Cryptomeria japonica]|nr:hypothetical protein SUGI_0569420 [Cryptomeria japonica]